MRKLIALITALLFGLTNTVMAGPSVYAIKVDEKFGKVVSRFRADSSQASGVSLQDKQSNPNTKTVVLVQDAHSNLDAQVNMAKIITSLLPQLSKDDRLQTKDQRLSEQDNTKSLQSIVSSPQSMPFVGIEGAIGQYDFNELQKFPVQEAREIAGTEMVKKGVLIGAELANIITEKPFSLYGLEETELFKENYKAFYDVSMKQPEIVEAVEELESQIMMLKTPLYNEKLAAFDQAYTQYENKPDSMMQFMSTLYTALEETSTDIFTYVALLQFKEVFILQSKIDKAILAKEVQSIQDVLKNNGQLVNDNESAMNTDQLILSNKDSLQSLAAQAVKEGLSLKTYPNLDRQLQYWNKYGLLDMGALIKEIDTASHEVKMSLAQSSYEKSLVQVEDRVKRLKNMLMLKALKHDVEIVNEKRDEYKLSMLMKEIERISQDMINSQNNMIPAPTSGFEMGNKGMVDSAALQSDLDELLDRVFEYYNCADKRDQVMLDNLVKEMDRTGSTTSVMVAGGYHTEGLMEQMKERGISFVTVQPHINLNAENVGYMDRLMGKILPLNQSAFTGMSGLSASRFQATTQGLQIAGILADAEGDSIPAIFTENAIASTFLIVAMNKNGLIRDTQERATILTKIYDELFAKNIADIPEVIAKRDMFEAVLKDVISYLGLNAGVQSQIEMTILMQEVNAIIAKHGVDLTAISQNQRDAVLSLIASIINTMHNDLDASCDLEGDLGKTDRTEKTNVADSGKSNYERLVEIVVKAIDSGEYEEFADTALDDLSQIAGAFNTKGFEIITEELEKAREMNDEYLVAFWTDIDKKAQSIGIDKTEIIHEDSISYNNVEGGTLIAENLNQVTTSLVTATEPIINQAASPIVSGEVLSTGTQASTVANNAVATAQAVTALANATAAMIATQNQAISQMNALGTAQAVSQAQHVQAIQQSFSTIGAQAQTIAQQATTLASQLGVQVGGASAMNPPFAQLSSTIQSLIVGSGRVTSAAESLTMQSSFPQNSRQVAHAVIEAQLQFQRGLMSFLSATIDVFTHYGDQLSAVDNASTVVTHIMNYTRQLQVFAKDVDAQLTALTLAMNQSLMNAQFPEMTIQRGGLTFIVDTPQGVSDAKIIQNLDALSSIVNKAMVTGFGDVHITTVRIGDTMPEERNMHELFLTADSVRGFNSGDAAQFSGIVASMRASDSMKSLITLHQDHPVIGQIVSQISERSPQVVEQVGDSFGETIKARARELLATHAGATIESFIALVKGEADNLLLNKDKINSMLDELRQASGDEVRGMKEEVLTYLLSSILTQVLFETMNSIASKEKNSTETPQDLFDTILKNALQVWGNIIMQFMTGDANEAASYDALMSDMRGTIEKMLTVFSEVTEGMPIEKCWDKISALYELIMQSLAEYVTLAAFNPNEDLLDMDKAEKNMKALESAYTVSDFKDIEEIHIVSSQIELEKLYVAQDRVKNDSALKKTVRVISMNDISKKTQEEIAAMYSGKVVNYISREGEKYPEVLKGKGILKVHTVIKKESVNPLVSELLPFVEFAFLRMKVVAVAQKEGVAVLRTSEVFAGLTYVSKHYAEQVQAMFDRFQRMAIARSAA